MEISMPGERLSQADGDDASPEDRTRRRPTMPPCGQHDLTGRVACDLTVATE
jgi:hypothetical protein